MESWSPLQITLAFLAAIFIPGLIAHFTIGRNGGHHLLDNYFTPEEIKTLPYRLVGNRLRIQTGSTIALIIGFLVTILIQRSVCNTFGLTASEGFWISITVVSFVALIAYLVFFKQSRSE